MKADHTKPSGKTQKRSRSGGKGGSFWIVFIFIFTILLSGVFSFLSQELLHQAGLAAAFMILLVIVMTGILFDIIGVAVTAADSKPFHSMAAQKIPEAPDALRLLRNADRVSNFCNDVIGDICGVISGAASATIATRVILNFELRAETIFQLLLSALVAGITVGGKALGKSFAIGQSSRIVHTVARILCFFRLLPVRIGQLFRKHR